MIILLPPSESKAVGGDGAFEAADLGFPGLAASRIRALDALATYAAGDHDESTPAKRRWVADNRAVRSAPAMPAIERYDGVLFGALDVASLEDAARAWVDAHVVVHSALFGFVRASDRIPSYKVSSSTRLASVTQRSLWADAGGALPDGLVVDLRSGSYQAVAPVRGAVTVEVVGESGRALNHWNKHAKGELVRRMAEDRLEATSASEVAAWSARAGIRLTETDAGLRLVASPAGLSG